MEKMKKIKNMCELEKYVGEMAHKKLMFCKGFYLSTGVPFYDDYFGCKPCAECKECKRYLYRRQYMNLFYAVAIVFGILMMLILGTPHQHFFFKYLIWTRCLAKCGASVMNMAISE